MRVWWRIKIRKAWENMTWRDVDTIKTEIRRTNDLLEKLLSQATGK